MIIQAFYGEARDAVFHLFGLATELHLGLDPIRKHKL